MVEIGPRSPSSLPGGHAGEASSSRQSRFAALRLDRRVYLLGSAGLVRSIGRSATFVFLPLVFADIYHLSYLDIGALVAAIVPVSTLAFLAGGHLSDRYGRRPFAVYPSFVSAGLMFLMWIYLEQGVPIVMGLWALNSLFNGLNRPAQSAMIGDVTHPDLAVTAFGVQRVFTNTGFAISPAVGGFLADVAGLPVLFLFAAITSLIEGTVLLLLLRESFAGSKGVAGRSLGSIAAPFRDHAFLGLLGALVGLAVLMNQFSTPLALFLGSVRSVSFTEFGLIYSLNGALVVLLQLPIGRLIERRQQYLAWMAAGTIAYGASFLLFDLANAFPLYLVSMGVLTIGEDIVSPTQQSLVAGFGGPERRGAYFGAYNAVTNASRVVAPVIGTLLLGVTPDGPTILWVGMFMLSVAVAVAFLRMRANARRRAEEGGARAVEILRTDALRSGRD